MRRPDRRGAIRIADATDNGVACPLGGATLLARFHAEENGQMLSGAAAFAAMWRAIPLLRPLCFPARSHLVLRTLEWGCVRSLTVRPHPQAFVRRLDGRRGATPI